MAISQHACPKCGGEMWDETTSKYFKPGKPIAKCKDKGVCDGVVFAPKQNGGAAARQPVSHPPAGTMPFDEPRSSTSWDEIKRRYAECFAFVTDKVTPVMVKSDIGIDPSTVAAMVAVLFIERQKKGV